VIVHGGKIVSSPLWLAEWKIPVKQGKPAD